MIYISRFHFFLPLHVIKWPDPVISQGNLSPDLAIFQIEITVLWGPSDCTGTAQLVEKYFEVSFSVHKHTIESRTVDCPTIVKQKKIQTVTLNTMPTTGNSKMPGNRKTNLWNVESNAPSELISIQCGQSCLTAEVRRGHSIYTRHKNSKWSFYHHVRNSHVNIYKVKIISINREVRNNAQSKLRNFDFCILSMY